MVENSFNDDCWLWPFGKTGKGYGAVWVDNTTKDAHLVAYQIRYPSYIEIRIGLHLDHLCRNTACFNPSHLELVTPKENTNRGKRFNSEKTHCKRGHEFTEENTYRYKNSRKCRKCMKIWEQIRVR